MDTVWTYLNEDKTVEEFLEEYREKCGPSWYPDGDDPYGTYVGHLKVLGLLLKVYTYEGEEKVMMIGSITTDGHRSYPHDTEGLIPDDLVLAYSENLKNEIQHLDFGVW